MELGSHVVSPGPLERVVADARSSLTFCKVYRPVGAFHGVVLVRAIKTVVEGRPR